MMISDSDLVLAHPV